jgi:hypothetical protein
MPTSKKYKSKKAAEETLKRFFANKPASDQVSVEEIFRAAGRQGKQPTANMAWLSNKLTTLRYHDLINSEYSYQGKRRLKSISLSLDGKRALRRVGSANSPNAYQEPPEAGRQALGDQEPSLDDALALVSQLRKRYPEFDIDLTVKPKQD